MAELRTVQDLGDVTGKTVIVRSDLDVPVEDGRVTSSFRLKQASQTIKQLLSQKAKVVIIGHIGRPENAYEDEYSLMPVRFELGKLLEQHIKFAHVPQSRNSIRYMEPGEALMLENVRFHPEENSDDAALREAFAKPLAELADFYVNDAFATYRTPAASLIELAQYFDAPVAGIQLHNEVERLSEVRDNPNHPYVAVIGGAKLDTKIPVLEKLVTQADYILIGGSMAYTFLQSQGVQVGDSKVESEMLDAAKRIMQAAKANGCEIVLPIDHVVGNSFAADADKSVISGQEIPSGLMGLDIGPETIQKFQTILSEAQSILWNGPMGVFEWSPFAVGSDAIADFIAHSSKAKQKIAGGGDTVAAIEQFQINPKHFTHISTGGGAMLAFLAGEKIPAIELLRN